MKFLTTLYIALLFISCNTSPPSDKNSTQQTPPPAAAITPPPITEKGVITTVNVQADASQSYALFVPDTIGSDTLVLVFFDPGAKGKTPIEQYKALAQKQGIILAGSNNSKNGMEGRESVAIAKKLIQDLKARFSLRNKNIYASGFSGGARVAVLTTMEENLPGVIGCGAGFPGKPEGNYGFNYVGIVGNEDFNFLEMKRLYSNLDAVKMKHQLIVFDGKHEWCPEPEMEKAVLLVRKDAASKQVLAEKIDAAVQEFKKKKDWTRLYDELRMGVTSGLDSAHVKNWREELQGLKKNKACIDELRTEAQVESQEANTQTEIKNAFATRNFTLINTRVKAFSEGAKKSSLQKLSDTRLLQFVSLMGFMYSEKSLNSDMNLAKQYLDIYGKADPENHDYHYLMACYYAKKGDSKAAMTSLKKAAELGFDDEEKLANNQMLVVLHSEAGYAEVVQKVSAN